VAQARAKEKRAQEAYATEHSSHEATKSQLEALQQHTATASSGDSAKEAKYRAELDALSAELQRKEKSHSAELAAAAQLEQRWRDSVREAQRMRRELSPQAGPEEDSAEDGEVFVCYLCQKGVHNL
jgi:serine phosphatase RsbU (regulator of sigma subunit)